MIDYLFLGRTLFFPKEGILAVGDLHLGYEIMLLNSGVILPKTQRAELAENLKLTFKEIKDKGYTLKKIVFLGDIKHAFGFEEKERYEVREFFSFLKEYIQDENIILIKGNHDTIDYSFGKMQDSYEENGILFIHGHNEPSKESLKNSKLIVMGHIHPSVILSEKEGVKKENYKCFLVGKYKKKSTIILPSFFSIVEGTPVNDYSKDYADHFSIIPKDELKKFKIYAIGDKGVYGFSKVEDLSSE